MAGIMSRTRRAYLQEAEARAEQAQTGRDREVALAAAQERTRIARELHDVVAHHVSLIAVQSDAAATLLPGQPVQAKHVEVIGQTAREAMGELRRLLGVLRTPADFAGREPPPDTSRYRRSASSAVCSIRCGRRESTWTCGWKAARAGFAGIRGSLCSRCRRGRCLNGRRAGRSQ